LASHEPLRLVVASKLEDNWSPEQIAGWLKASLSRRRGLSSVARDDLSQPARPGPRRPEEGAAGASPLATGNQAFTSRDRKGDQRGSTVDAVSIRERPSSVEDRAVPGHWEGDLLCGSSNSHIVTLVERHSRYVMLAKVPNRESRSVVTALIEHAQCLPGELCRSLTWDRGKEMAEHKRFTMATDVAVYFCDPQSPWQRGSNENTNRLLRQYFPRGRIYRCTARRGSRRWPERGTSGPEIYWTTKRPLSDLTRVLP
jgi:IS30 family transposase